MNLVTEFSILVGAFCVVKHCAGLYFIWLAPRTAVKDCLKLTGLLCGDEVAWAATPALRLSYRLLLLLMQSDQIKVDQKQEIVDHCKGFVFTKAAEARLLAETIEAFRNSLLEWRKEAKGAMFNFVVGVGKSILTMKVDSGVFDGIRKGIKAGHMAWKNKQGREILRDLMILQLPPKQATTDYQADQVKHILERIAEAASAQRDSWQIQTACVYQMHRIIRIILAKKEHKPEDLQALELAVAGHASCQGLLKYCRLSQRSLSNKMSGIARKLTDGFSTAFQVYVSWGFSVFLKAFSSPCLTVV